MVAEWLEKRMFKGKPDASQKAKVTSKYFNDAAEHKSHGHRIDREEARSQEVKIEDLEDDQDLQDTVLTAYHLVTIGFEKSPATKEIVSNSNRMWIKNQ